MSNKSNKTPTKHNVLFLSRLLSPHVGGVERHVDGMVKVLKTEGYRFTVITEQFNQALALKEETELYEVYRIPKNSRSKMSVWLWMLQHFSLFFRADIIHAHDVFWWVLPMRFLFFWKPFFTTFHGHEGMGKPTEKAIRARRIAAQLSKGNICVGQWITKWYGTKPDAVTYGAADFSAKPQVHTKNAVFIGRLAEDTGALEYIQGAKLLHGKINLEVYGEGEQLSVVKALMDEHVVYKGISTDVATILARHRFAFVSGYLGMIEAMQTGRYVFAHWNSPLKRDYLEGFPGIKFASTFNLPEELAQEVSYILSHPKVEQDKIQQAQAWALKQQWQKVANIYKEVWAK